MHKITSLELLRTPILCLVQLSKLRESEATDAQKRISQSEKLLMKFKHVVFKLSSGGARQILRLISTGGTQSR